MLLKMVSKEEGSYHRLTRSRTDAASVLPRLHKEAVLGEQVDEDKRVSHDDELTPLTPLVGDDVEDERDGKETRFFTFDNINDIVSFAGRTSPRRSPTLRRQRPTTVNQVISHYFLFFFSQINSCRDGLP